MIQYQHVTTPDGQNAGVIAADADGMLEMARIVTSEFSDEMAAADVSYENSVRRFCALDLGGFFAHMGLSIIREAARLSREEPASQPESVIGRAIMSASVYYIANAQNVLGTLDASFVQNTFGAESKGQVVKVLLKLCQAASQDVFQQFLTSLYINMQDEDWTKRNFSRQDRYAVGVMMARSRVLGAHEGEDAVVSMSEPVGRTLHALAHFLMDAAKEGKISFEEDLVPLWEYSREIVSEGARSFFGSIFEHPVSDNPAEAMESFTKAILDDDEYLMLASGETLQPDTHIRQRILEFKDPEDRKLFAITHSLTAFASLYLMQANYGRWSDKHMEELLMRLVSLSRTDSDDQKSGGLPFGWQVSPGDEEA